MRFEKGSKVEVWNTRDIPSGSWWSAEIISGKGHYYFVKYHGYPKDSRMTVDRVPITAIRPCPPPLGDLNELTSGDVIEVFDDNSWKLAQVLMAVGKYCYVALLGSSQEFKIHKSQIRRGLSWLHNQWMMICKDSGNQNSKSLSSQLRGGKSSCYLSKSCEKMDNSARKNPFSGVFLRDTKKRPRDISIPEMCNLGRGKTRRAIYEDGRCHRKITNHLVECPEKVYSIACTGRLLGEEYMNGYLNSRLRKGRHSPDKQTSIARSSKPSDCESTSSSVGSCSISSPCRSQQHHVPLSSQEMNSHYNHDENSRGFEIGSPIYRKGDVQVVNHQLELQAYCSILKAFFASGSVSWEREAIMTNLRLELNISNDEHLMVLRKLIHSETATATS